MIPGRNSLLPGFRTELTGVTHEAALALLAAGSSRGTEALGLGTARGSAMRKVVDALPEGHRGRLDDGAARLLIEPETDLLSRRQVGEDLVEG